MGQASGRFLESILNSSIKTSWPQALMVLNPAYPSGCEQGALCEHPCLAMRFKLDENLGNRTQALFQEAGLDVETVYSEQMVGATDETLFGVCKSEGRCLITLDLDFADIIRYPPQDNPGVIVLRIPDAITLQSLEVLSRQILNALPMHDPMGKLWIVEPGRLRIHRDE